MDEDFFSPKAVVGKLDNIEQEMALYEERVFFLTRLLLLQEASSASRLG